MIKAVTAGILVTSALASTAAHAQNGRLPAGVTPLSYDITVDPDAAKRTFTGSTTIAIQVAKPTATITLNAVDLTIAEVKLDGAAAAKVSTDTAAQTATFTFAKPVTAGKHNIAIRYSGKINQSAAGLFTIDYNNPDGSKDVMLATQFEAADGRRFAPMWDEPGIKTPFTLSAAAPAGQTAFSNMPVSGKSPGAGGKTIWHFKPTPKMSTYLLYLGIGNVDRKTVMEGNVEIGIISRKGVVDQGDYALASAKRILTAYNDYFGTPYPLPKMDMIAGPGSSQFFSAMENWGAIFYFERVLLLDPKLETEGQKQDVFGVVAHETAHQWFGDLVTMGWWEDLWLNEGFASWMASKISGDLNPTWGATSQTLAFDRQNAMTRDARSTTHAIVQPIASVDAINDAFDDITYRKGEAVIRMLEGAVGPDVFRKGVQSYMAKYKYGNTETDQLWAEVGAAAGKPVKPMMDSFIRQGGVPLIKVGDPVCSGGSTKLTLTQGRFGLDAESKQPRSWIVPVSVGPIAGSSRELVMTQGNATATVPGCEPVLVNKGQSGYFRTLYSDAHELALRKTFGTLAVDDQIGFTADRLALANSGDRPIDNYFALIDGVAPNANPILWSLIVAHLNSIDRVLADAPQQVAYRVKARKLLAPVFARVGWTAKPGELPGDAQLREDIIPVLGTFGDPTVVSEAARYAEQSYTRPGTVPGPISQPAQRVYAYTADAARWDALHARVKAESSPAAKQIMYRNLGGAADKALAQKALDLALTDEASVPLRADIIASVAREHPAMAFDWAVAHADAVNALLEASTRSSFIVGLPAASGDPAVAVRIKTYADRALAANQRKPAEVTISSITYRAGLRQMQAAAIAKWAGAK